MMMIIDLSDCIIDTQPDIDSYLVHTLNYMVPLPYLTRDKWIVLWTADTPEANNNDMTDSYFHSNFATRVELHDDKDMWMVPL